MGLPGPPSDRSAPAPHDPTVTGGTDLVTVVEDDDRAFLERAIELGWGGWARVYPNPMVGCVLVRDGQVVGSGWHEALGGPHAEVNALRQAGERARGATAYVSLEPCGHVGRTPPCASALAEAGVTRVVFGASDPAEGAGGADELRDRGIRVDGPVLGTAEGRALNPSFFHRVEHEPPYVALKLASSLDGYIGRPGERTRVTGPEAWEHVHWLRAGFDGIMVGANTAAVDDPRLTARGDVTPRRPPARIILDTEAGLASDAAVFDDVPDVPLHLFTGLEAPRARVEALTSAGGSVHAVGSGASGLDLAEVLARCAELGMERVLCEGGGILASSLLRGRFVARLYLYIAAMTLGPEGVRALPGPFPEGIGEGWRPAEVPRVLGDTVLITLDRAA